LFGVEFSLMKQVVYGFPRTIYKSRGQSPGFLNPWTSLEPSFLRKKIAPDILGVFRSFPKGLKFESFVRVKGKSVDPEQINEHWVLVLPKRSYLPPDYPHFQLWLLTRSFAPSPKFLGKSQRQTLMEIVRCFSKLYKKYSRDFNKKGKVAFGFNSTPFSFIKDKQGRYYAGGQSVRVFHLHFLLIPPPKEITVKKEEQYLVYPTDFALSLFGLLFTQKKIQEAVGLPAKASVKVGRRGIEIDWPGWKESSYLKLGEAIEKIDRLLYRVQLILVRSFYQDSKKLLGEIERLEKTNDVAEARRHLGHLLVVGKERPLEDCRSILAGQLEKLGRGYKVNFAKKELTALVGLLSINENGDIASFVFGRRVVLRPGMGYGMMIEVKRKKVKVKINPLDVLGSKGLIESSGYWFEKKIIKNEYPGWATPLVTQLTEELK